MKKNLLRLTFAVILFSAFYGNATAYPVDVAVKQVITPKTPGPRSVIPDYVRVTIDTDMQVLTVSFNYRIENVTILVNHSTLGLIVYEAAAESGQNFVTLPIPDEEGVYTVTILGKNYEALGSYTKFNE